MKIIISRRIIGFIFWIAIIVLAAISAFSYSRVDLKDFLIVSSGDILSFATLFFVYYFLNRESAEHKLSEDAKLANELKLLESQKSAHIGNWEWDLTTNKLNWSSENYTIYGLPSDTEPTLENFFKTIDPKDIEFVRNEIDLALKGKKSYNIDIHILLPTGEKRIVNAQAKVEFDPLGKAKRMVGTVQDITDRKLAEEKLEESEKKLKEEIIILNDALAFKKTAEKELNKKIHDLEVFQNAVVGRELQMIELKKKISELESELEGFKKA